MKLIYVFLVATLLTLIKFAADIDSKIDEPTLIVSLDLTLFYMNLAMVYSKYRNRFAHSFTVAVCAP